MTTPPAHAAPQRTPLKQLASLVRGYGDPERSDSQGELGVLQARDVTTDGVVRWNQLERCIRRPASERALLRRDDVLITVRAAEPRVLRIGETPFPVVAGATFVILRCDRGPLDPDYLHWLLGSDRIRERLRKRMRGSTMPFLALADLADFDIPVPPLPVQRAIAAVQQLRERLAALTARRDAAVGRLLEAAASRSSIS